MVKRRPGGRRDSPHASICLLPLFVRLAHGPSETDLAVVDPQVEPAVRIAAHPRLVRDGCAVLAVVAQREERTFTTLTARRKFSGIQRSSLLQHPGVADTVRWRDHSE